MKLPVSKPTALAGLGVVLVAGMLFAVQSERNRREPHDQPPAAASATAPLEDDDTEAGPAGKAPSNRAPRPTCASSPAVDDPGLKPDPARVAKTFSSRTMCFQHVNGLFRACNDTTPETCPQMLRRVANLYKDSKCVPKPSEAYCMAHRNPTGKVTTACFGTKEQCENVKKVTRTRPSVCEIMPECERVAL